MTCLIISHFILSWQSWPAIPSLPFPQQRLLHNIAAAPARIELPAPGTISGASGRRDSPLLFCKFTSFVHPGTILKVDVAEGSGSSVQVRCRLVPLQLCVAFPGMF